MTELPRGFRGHVANIGVKDATDDLVVVAADRPCATAALFTQSSFAGPSVIVSREHARDGQAQAVVVISKNANVATGAEGLANAHEVVAGIAKAVGCAEDDVLIASTGVIGRQYPMGRVRAGLAALPIEPGGASVERIARGIMTTDTVPKIATASVNGASIVGVAKGVGMIEPDMATLITLIFTDAALSASDLGVVTRRVVGRTFNCLSVDTDTSTSDTAIVMASGAAGAVDPAMFETALHEVALSLTKQIARDGEGAGTLVEVHVDGAAHGELAKRVAKAIVNSPLVKTAVHGADPNWGRVAMAIGKASTAREVDQSKVIIRFGDQEVYPRPLSESALDDLGHYMAGDEVRIHVTLDGGDASATVWGCDLTAGYVRINADYTT